MFSVRAGISAGVVIASTWQFASVAPAQVRGVYPLGMNATNSGVTPESGFTYSNALLYYERARLTGPDGETVATGKNSVLLDMNTVLWVSNSIAWLGNGKFSASVTVPFAENSLTSDEVGQISGAAGLGDSYLQPLILGWQTPRADIRFIYGLLMPTGRFGAGADNNVGSGYWTNTVASGQTIYLTKDKATALSAFEMYEIHTQQPGTHIHPGDTFNLDYSLTRTFALSGGLKMQLGPAGYEEWQTSAVRGPQVTPAEAAARYQVNALGLAANIIVPNPKMTFGLKFFKEFSTKSTFEGYSLQGAFAIKL